VGRGIETGKASEFKIEIFLPTGKPNDSFVYNAGGRLDIYDKA
jgi:hypothetical protein